MTEPIIRLGDKSVDLSQAFPIDLGFIEDAIAAGVDLMNAEQGLTPDQGLKLVKLILKRCGCSEEEARKLPMSELASITKVIEEKMETESEVRPT